MQRLTDSSEAAIQVFRSFINFPTLPVIFAAWQGWSRGCGWMKEHASSGHLDEVDAGQSGVGPALQRRRRRRASSAEIAKSSITAGSEDLGSCFTARRFRERGSYGSVARANVDRNKVERMRALF